MDQPTYAAFVGHRRLAHGALPDVARSVCAHSDGAVQVFDDSTGHPVELDIRHGAEAAVAEFLQRTTAPAATRSAGRGRPRLGVVAREVTLLPRHWEWLAGQPGGASAALRRLVEEASRDTAAVAADRARRARDAAYRVMTALAGDLPDYEAATRALFRGEAAALRQAIAGWPDDVAAYVLRVAQADA